jgi:protein TonB
MPSDPVQVAPVVPEATSATASDSAPSSSPRPAARPEAQATARPVPPKTAALPEPRPQRCLTPETKAQARAPGNAATDARKGSASGQEGGKAANAGRTSARGAEGGNAAAANYPGEVLRKITRLRRPTAPARGTVVVSFTISGSGALASAGIVRPSGSPTLDRIALDHIRRAGPFPPPPAGARTAFSFEFVGRP